MTEIPLLENFDLTIDPGLVSDPWRRWDELREEHRVFRADFGPDPIWVFTRYDEVYQAMQDPELFSSACAIVTDPVGSHKWIPTEVDGPLLKKYRNILLPWLSPGAVKALEPRIRERCAELIDSFVDDGRCDFVTQFAQLLPSSIFMEIVGMPVERSPELLGWARQYMHTPRAEDPDGSIIAAAAAEISAFLDELVADRRARPREDLISALTTAQVDGQRIPEKDLAEMLFVLYQAGLDTVTAVLGSFFHQLALSPDSRRLMAKSPTATPSAVEELLRAFGVVATGRVVTRDVDWNGCPLSAGDRLLLPLLSASRDPRAFNNATELDLERGRNKHLAFGLGPHRCVGSTLARSELTIALEEWHARIPEYTLDEELLVAHYSGPVTGYDHIPLKWNA